MRPLLAWTALLLIVVLFVHVLMWMWRDFEKRGRPIWLRVLAVVVAVTPLNPLAIAIFCFDLWRHPHDPGLTKRDVLMQRWVR